MLICGNHGIGKNIIVSTILSELGYIEKKFQNYVNVRSVSELVSEILSSNIFDEFQEKKEIPKIALVIDNLDTKTSLIERNLISELRATNDVRKYFPLIFISSSEYTKFKNDIQKKAFLIKLYPPETIEIYHFVKKIINEEKLNIHGEDLIHEIILYVQGNENTPDEYLTKAIKEICDLIIKFCGGEYRKIE